MLPAYVPAAFFLYRKERPEGRSSQMKQVTYGIYGCKGKAGCKALDTDLHPIHRQDVYKRQAEQTAGALRRKESQAGLCVLAGAAV